MLIDGSELVGYAIAARDGAIGTVCDALFDDTVWTIRWLVVETGDWLHGRRVLIHPSAIEAPDHAQRRLPIRLTRAQVKAAPDLLSDPPVTLQMQNGLWDHYAWDPAWSPDLYGGGQPGLGPFGSFGAVYPRGTGVLQLDAPAESAEGGDLHLRSMAAILQYRICAADGPIGHVETVLVDASAWAIRYLVVDTRNWWPGAHVLISPAAVTGIDSADGEVGLAVSQAQVKASPPWNRADPVELGYERKLRDHYGWTGFGW